MWYLILGVIYTEIFFYGGIKPTLTGAITCGPKSRNRTERFKMQFKRFEIQKVSNF